MAVALVGSAVGRPAGSWRERWLDFRNRLIASADFQRWARRFPLTRPIARRRARALFDLAAGFVYAQVLAACVRLKLFELLADGALPVAAVAARTELGEPAALRLLEAAVSLRLAERLPDGRFGLGDLGAAMLANPSIGAMVEHHAMLYADLADPVALLRGERGDTALGRYWPYAGEAEPALGTVHGAAAYSTLMAQSQALVGDEILDAYPLGRHRALIDIGGGEGVFLAAAGARAPDLTLMLFDLPAVIPRAAARLDAAGLGARVSLHGGSFLAEPLPVGADLATLVRVLHDHDDAAALAILRRARAALPPGGTLLVAEPMAGTRGAEPAGDAYFGFYLLAMGSGRPRTAAELGALMRAAGFESVVERRTDTPLLVRVLTALVPKPDKSPSSGVSSR